MYRLMEKFYKRVTTISGADCGTDHNLLIAIVKIMLKQTKRNKTTQKYYLEKLIRNILYKLRIDSVYYK